MGFYLFHENMFSSVIYARDRFLKPNGLLLPCHARLWASPVEMSSFWDKHLSPFRSDDFNLGLLSSLRAEQILSNPEPQILDLLPSQLLSDPVLIGDYDLTTITVDQLEHISAALNFTVSKDGLFHGVSLFWDVRFPLSNVVLDTSPLSPPTHWKQTVILLPTSEGFPVSIDTPLSAQIDLVPTESNYRHYQVALSFPDDDEDALAHDDDL